MAGPSPETIRGRDWHKEVGGVSYKKQAIREKFYLERAKFKLGVEGMDEISNNPKTHGFLSLKEIRKVPDFRIDTIQKGQTLPQILKEFFKQAGVTDSRQIDREMYLTLYYLSNECYDVRGRKINVDLIRIGETLEIKDGQLTIRRPNGEARIQDVFIRMPQN